MRAATLHKILAVLMVLMVLMAAALVFTHLNGGLVAAVMGVAGCELLIPTIVLLDGSDIKLAGSRGRSMTPSVPSPVTADQAGFVARGNHSG